MHLLLNTCESKQLQVVAANTSESASLKQAAHTTQQSILRSQAATTYKNMCMGFASALGPLAHATAL